MITSVEVVSAFGDTLMMPLQDVSDGYVVQDIDGLDPVRATVSSSSFAQLDGEQFQSSKLEKRNIILTIGLYPDYVNTDVKGLRHGLYTYFMPKSSVTLRFYVDGVLFCYIQGRIESTESPLFTRDPETTVSILCFDPVFVSTDITSVNLATVSDTTDSSVTYSGSVPTGMLLRVYPDRDFTGLDIFNQAGGLYQALEFNAPLLTGDEVVISTVARAKGAHIIRTGTEFSALYGVSPDSSWINLYPGNNLFRISVDGAPVPYTIEYTAKYGGL